jgi:hypothetical protein
VHRPSLRGGCLVLLLAALDSCLRGVFLFSTRKVSLDLEGIRSTASFTNSLDNESHIFFSRTKTIIGPSCCWFKTSSSFFFLLASSDPTIITLCSTVSTACPALPTITVAGLRIYFRANLSSSGGIVALNMTVCRYRSSFFPSRNIRLIRSGFSASSVSGFKLESGRASRTF